MEMKIEIGLIEYQIHCDDLNFFDLKNVKETPTLISKPCYNLKQQFDSLAVNPCQARKESNSDACK